MAKSGSPFHPLPHCAFRRRLGAIGDRTSAHRAAEVARAVGRLAIRRASRARTLRAEQPLPRLTAAPILSTSWLSAPPTSPA